MQAIIFTNYGSPDVLELHEVDKPVPKPNEVLIRVHAVSINDWDAGALDGTSLVNRLMFGLVKPKKRILGSDVAGTVEAVGAYVSKFKPGDEVFGDLSGEWGGFAEYVCARETALARKPPQMTFEQAAAIPQAGMLAFQGLRDAKRLQAGQQLLINGAGGGVGTFAIQMAKAEGVEVTAVDSAPKLEMLRALGADHVVDYTREDFTAGGRTYDLILDVKTNRSISRYARALKPDGMYVTVGGSMARVLQMLVLMPLIRNRRFHVVMLEPNRDLAQLCELFAAGTLTPVIDGPYALHEVPRAMRYFMEARHKGKVVISVR